MLLRIGLGFDTHKFAAGRRLVLGGVDIPFHLGLEGHSDADVLCHAVIDAVLGSIAAGDIGSHFPDIEARYKNISSLELLSRTAVILTKAGWRIANLDTVVMLEKPKLAGYREVVSKNIAKTLRIDFSQVSVKATTTEGLGFTGRGEGAAAQAVVLVEKQS